MQSNSRVRKRKWVLAELDGWRRAHSPFPFPPHPSHQQDLPFSKCLDSSIFLHLYHNCVIFSFNKYILKVCCVPGSVLVAERTRLTMGCEFTQILVTLLAWATGRAFALAVPHFPFALSFHSPHRSPKYIVKISILPCLKPSHDFPWLLNSSTKASQVLLVAVCVPPHLSGLFSHPVFIPHRPTGLLSDPQVS